MEDQPTDSNKPDEDISQEAAKKSYSNSFILLASVLVIFGLIFMIPQIFSPPSSDDISKEIIQKGETNNGYMYNGFVFIHQDELWHTKWQAGDTMLNLHFHYGPRDVENIPMIGALENTTNTVKFYITFDPTEKNISLIALASSELALNLVKGMNVQLTPACSKNETDGCLDRPIITCENTNKSVIFVKTSETAQVLLEKNCITVEGPGDDLLKAVDKFLYSSYNIIEKKS